MIDLSLPRSRPADAQWHLPSMVFDARRTVPSAARRLGSAPQRMQRAVDDLLEGGQAERRRNPDRLDPDGRSSCSVAGRASDARGGPAAEVTAAGSWRSMLLLRSSRRRAGQGKASSPHGVPRWRDASGSEVAIRSVAEAMRIERGHLGETAIGCDGEVVVRGKSQGRRGEADRKRVVHDEKPGRASRRHTSVLLGEALSELRKWDRAVAEQIASHIPVGDLPGVKRGIAGTGVIKSGAYPTSSAPRTCSS